MNIESDKLVVSFSIEDKSTAVESLGIWIVMKVTNISDKEYYILTRNTPFDAQVCKPYFKVSSTEGPLKYLGKISKRSSISEDDFISIAPGEYINDRVNIADNYRLESSGVYSLWLPELELYYTRSIDRVGDKRLSKLKLGTIGFQLRVENPSIGLINLSNIHYTYPDLSKKKAIIDIENLTYNSCEKDQIATLIRIQDLAKEIIDSAIKLLESDPNGTNKKYIEWFGAYNKIRFGKVVSNFKSIQSALMSSLSAYHCNGPTCVDKGEKKEYAYILAGDKTKTIFLCKLFHKALETGMNSKPGILIHELSHHYANTDDVAYGVNECRKLAKNNPNLGIRNADSYVYYSES